MLILVLGENGSGKSAYAETLALRLGGERRYIATMIPHGPEGAARVEKHKLQRAGMGFTTLELPYAVGGADIPEGAAVLLEDVSNLLSNRMFERGGAAADTLADILALQARCGALIAVTITHIDPAEYRGETRAYAQALQTLNGALLSLADAAVELQNGKPVLRKGDACALA